MSLFDRFLSKPDAASAPNTTITPNTAPAAAPSTPGNIPPSTDPATQQTQQTDANGLIPSQQPAPGTGNKNDSPLDQFSKLWEDVPNKDADPTVVTPTQLNPEDLQKVMGKVDFSGAISAENVAAINAGGEGAAAAFTDAMTKVAQQVMVQSTLVSNKLTEKAVAQAIEATEAKIPSLLRSQATASHLKDSNPLFNDPAIAPIIDATRDQLQTKFPNDTPAETTQKLNDYITAMGAAFAPPPAAATSVDKRRDFSSFLAKG